MANGNNLPPLPAGASYWGLDKNGNLVPFNAQGQQMDTQTSTDPPAAGSQGAANQMEAQAAQYLQEHPTQQMQDAADAAQKQQQTAESQKQSAAAAAKSQKQKQQDILDQMNELIKNASYPDMYGAGVGTLGSQIGRLLAQLPANVASMWLSQNQHIFKNAPQLGQAITSTAQSAGGPAATTKAAGPVYDPLALQTMYNDVFRPVLQQANALASQSGNDYLSAMKQAIAGSNASPAQQKQQLNQAQVMSALLNNAGIKQPAAAAAQIPFDSLLAVLGQASGAATAAQGEAEKAYAVGQTAATAPYFTGGATGATSALSPGGAANTLNSALSFNPSATINASQTTNPNANPLMPTLPYVP
jgi:hypothetical protein